MWVLGVQRSGTNLLTRTLQGVPEIAVFSENHRRAFVDYRLRSDDDIRHLIGRVPPPAGRVQAAVRLGPGARLLGAALLAAAVPPHLGLPLGGRPGALGAVPFGTANLEVMRAVAAGRHQGMWQTQGLSPDDLALIRSFDWPDDDCALAAALFWYVRNKLLFDLGLDTRPRVTVFSYDAFVAEPCAGAAVLAGVPRDRPGRVALPRPGAALSGRPLRPAPGDPPPLRRAGRRPRRPVAGPPGTPGALAHHHTLVEAG